MTAKNVKGKTVITGFVCDGSDLSIAFYNADNYNSSDLAADEGALYTVPSNISLYGASGCHDLIEIIDTMNECIGAGNMQGAILTKSGWVDVPYVLDYFKAEQQELSYGRNR